MHHVEEGGWGYTYVHVRERTHASGAEMRVTKPMQGQGSKVKTSSQVEIASQAQGKRRQITQNHASQVNARQGKAKQLKQGAAGKARPGKARQSKAKQGKARQGKARQGKARQGIPHL